MLMVIADGEPPLVFTEMPPISPPARPSYPISSSPILLLPHFTHAHTHSATDFPHVVRDVNTVACQSACAAYTVAIKVVSVEKHVTQHTQHSCPICECQWVNTQDRWGIINSSVMT